MWGPFFVIISLMLLLALNVFCVAFPFYIRSLNRPAEQDRRATLIWLLVCVVLVVLVADSIVGGFLWLVTRPDFAGAVGLVSLRRGVYRPGYIYAFTIIF